ncbi:hypothetical protein BHM03_00000489 [Ensete ventricosum]|nr:hypothetical protein BHM03_00000489 [Ensete ventricosum]
MRLGTRLECIESSPRVSGAYQDDAREFTGRRPRLAGRLSVVVERLELRSLPRWHKRVHRKKAETRRKIVGGSRKAYREMGRFNHDGEKELQIRHEPMIKLRHRAKVWKMRWELARSSLKVSGKSLETCREIAGGRP